jgi:hypothetical protein
LAAPKVTQNPSSERRPAYFSDRGRLFQSDRGRRFSVIVDGISRWSRPGTDARKRWG